MLCVYSVINSYVNDCTYLSMDSYQTLGNCLLIDSVLSAENVPCNVWLFLQMAGVYYKMTAQLVLSNDNTMSI